MIAMPSSSARTLSAGGQPGAADRGDRVQEPARAEPELHPAAAEQIQRRHAAGEHRGRPQRQVRHVGRDRAASLSGGDHRQQGPGVEKPRLVRMVLHA